MRPADEMLIDMLAPSNADLRRLADQHANIVQKIRLKEGRSSDPASQAEYKGLCAERDRVWGRIDDILTSYRSR